MENSQISEDVESPSVDVGAKVKVVCNGQPQCWQIVSPGQADPVAGKIATDAPLTTLLLGLRAGEESRGEIHGRPVVLQVEEVLIA